MWNDIHYAPWKPARSHGFTAVGLLIPALGIGANRLGRVPPSQLLGVGPFDVSSFVAAVAVVALAVLAACWLPARRAMRVAPIIALRHE